MQPWEIYQRRRAEQLSDLDELFREGGILEKNPEELEEYILALGTGSVPNDQVRHRAIVRALAINHLQLAGLIRDLEARNNQTQRLVIALTIAAVGVGAIQILLALLQFVASCST